MTSVDGQISVRGNRRFRQDGTGKEWTSKKTIDGSWTEWKEVETVEAAGPDGTLNLYVVQELQSEGEPRHWPLFVAKETGKGTIYSVTGDATFMRYAHAEDVDHRGSESFYTEYRIAALDQDGLRRLEQCANQVPPPQAPDRASVRANCQHWVIQLLRELQAQGVVSQESVDGMEREVEPMK